MGNVKDEISKNLLFYRKKKGYSQKEFAAMIGVKNSAVSNWEKGANSIDIEKLVEACTVLDVTIDDMFGVYAGTHKQTISPELTELTDLFSELDSQDQNAVIRQIKGLLLDEKYQNNKKRA